jgi:hypothetical protein
MVRARTHATPTFSFPCLQSGCVDTMRLSRHLEAKCLAQTLPFLGVPGRGERKDGTVSATQVGVPVISHNRRPVAPSILAQRIRLLIMTFGPRRRL